jgi:hypothetical protein
MDQNEIAMTMRRIQNLDPQPLQTFADPSVMIPDNELELDRRMIA